MQTLRPRTASGHGLSSSGSLHPGVLIVVQRFREGAEAQPGPHVTVASAVPVMSEYV